MADAFEIAERYRTPVMVLADGVLGQQMEPVVPEYRAPRRTDADWAVTSTGGTAATCRALAPPPAA